MPILASAFIASSAFAGGKGVIQTDVGVIGIDDVVVDISDEMESIVYGTYYTVGLKVGTLGLGLDVSYPLTHNFSIRGNVNGFSYTTGLTDIIGDDVEEFKTYGGNADGSIDFLTVGLLVDYFPFEHSDFRLSAGVYYNANELSITGGSTGVFDVGVQQFDASKAGSITGSVIFDDIAPYIGWGWGNRGDEKGWSWSLDFGVLYQNVPKLTSDVNLNTGAVLDDLNTVAIEAIDQTAINALVQTEVDTVNNDIQTSEFVDYTKFYPVIAIGITYSF